MEEQGKLSGILKSQTAGAGDPGQTLQEADLQWAKGQDQGQLRVCSWAMVQGQRIVCSNISMRHSCVLLGSY